jgi:acetyl-CoA carboxylase, biotin carboxylase subunit
MLRALDEFHIEGIKTTVPRLKELLSHSAFAEGRVDTTFIERNWAS